MLKRLKKKANPQPTTTVQGGFKIGHPPKSTKRRELIRGPDITASGGCRTVQHQSAK
jgi:hypothetical protein